MNAKKVPPQIAPATQALQRARLLMNVRKYDNALVEIQQALAESPDSPEAHYLAAACHYNLSANGPAKKEAKETLRLNPNHPAAHWLLASIALREKSYNAGLKHIKQSLEYEPGNPLYLATKASLLVSTGEPKKALQEVDEALRIRPHHEYANRVRTTALSGLGRHAEAGRQAADTLSAAPNSSMAWHQQGEQLWAEGKVEESKRAFLESLRLNPENRLAQKGLVKAVSYNHPFFALFWRFQFCLSHFSAPVRIVIIFGLMMGVGKFQSVADSASPGGIISNLIPVVWLLFILYILVAKNLFSVAMRRGWIK